MKKILFLLVILMTAASSAATARTSDNCSGSSATILPVLEEATGWVLLKASNGDSVEAWITEGISFTRISFDRPVDVANIEFFRRRPLELHSYAVGYMVEYLSLPFVTSEAKWEIRVRMNDGTEYKGHVQLYGYTPGSPDPREPYIIK